jgi:hypothetical protein
MLCMRGTDTKQASMLSLLTPEKRVPTNHPLRAMKTLTEAALNAMSPLFDAMYSTVGRTSIPPERLLKSSLLMALYSIRSERLFSRLRHRRADHSPFGLYDHPTHPQTRRGDLRLDKNRRELSPHSLQRSRAHRAGFILHWCRVQPASNGAACSRPRRDFHGEAAASLPNTDHFSV